jgi:hypothetical protein
MKCLARDDRGALLDLPGREHIRDGTLRLMAEDVFISDYEIFTDVGRRRPWLADEEL